MRRALIMLILHHNINIVIVCIIRHCCSRSLIHCGSGAFLIILVFKCLKTFLGVFVAFLPISIHWYEIIVHCDYFLDKESRKN